MTPLLKWRKWPKNVQIDRVKQLGAFTNWPEGGPCIVFADKEMGCQLGFEYSQIPAAVENSVRGFGKHEAKVRMLDLYFWSLVGEELQNWPC